MASLTDRPPVIAFISQTGSVLKTTLAAATGLAFVKAGRAALAIDLDNEWAQAGLSLKGWLDYRASQQPNREQLPCVAAASAEEALALAARADADVVLIDCPSRASEGSLYIAQHADFVILPLGAGFKDAGLTSITLGRIIAEGVRPDRLAVIVTRAGSATEAAELTSWLKELRWWGHGIHVIEAAIPERVAYRKAIDKFLAITEAQPVSVGRTARQAIDALIETFLAALDGSSLEHEAGLIPDNDTRPLAGAA